MITVITGGNKGLGLYLTDALLRQDHIVISLNRTPMNASSVINNSKLFSFETDITDMKAVNEAIQWIIHKYGRIDNLINNAALKLFCSIKAFDFKDWNRVMETNVGGAFIVTKAVLPQLLIQKRGMIVNIASKAGYRGYATAGAYSASKAALMRFTETFSSEMKRHGIYMTAVCPATIESPDVLDATSMNQSKFLKPASICNIILKLLSHPRKYTGRCILIADFRTRAKIVLLNLIDCYHMVFDTLSLKSN
jgi:3-oxoacyl-[acyl-carrier protein] reductase